MTHETTLDRTRDSIPQVRTLRFSDLAEALRAGWADFSAMPSHGLFLVVIYPVIGIVLATVIFGYDVTLLYPIAAGFALIGPVAALGLYELSRRREQGLETSPSHAVEVMNSRQLGAIARLGLALLVIFGLWLVTANLLWVTIMGEARPFSIGQMLSLIFDTAQGRRLLVVGTAVGAIFAALVLSIAVVSFPLLLDRRVDAVVAATTSLRAVARNPVVLGAWGVIVAGLLLLGSLPAFVGLAVVLPVLGHATWHLYRRTVV